MPLLPLSPPPVPATLAPADKDRLPWALGERVKELTALHGTARILQDGDRDPRSLLAEVAAFEGPFLGEERALIQSLAQMLQSHFDRRAAEEDLRRAHAGLDAALRGEAAYLHN